MLHMIPAKSWRRGGGKTKNSQTGPSLVPNDQSKGTIHILDGSSLQVTWGEGLLPVFRGLDAPSFYGSHFRHGFQLGCYHLQTAEHLHKTGPDTKRGGNPLLLHGLISVRRHLHQEHFLWNELELALFSSRSMYTSTFYGITGTKNPMPLSVTSLLHVSIFCCSGKNALGCQKKQKGLYPKWVTGI
jgi:hypothetical protein